jgi:DnaJ-class molecular chaperone
MSNVCTRPACLCGGTAHATGKTCPACNGSGFTWKRTSEQAEFYKSLCDKCSGVGIVDFKQRIGRPAKSEPVDERGLIALLGEPR